MHSRVCLENPSWLKFHRRQQLLEVFQPLMFLGSESVTIRVIRGLHFFASTPLRSSVAISGSMDPLHHVEHEEVIDDSFSRETMSAGTSDPQFHVRAWPHRACRRFGSLFPAANEAESDQTKPGHQHG